MTGVEVSCQQNGARTRNPTKELQKRGLLSGQIAHPAQSFFRLVLGFVILVSVFVVGTSLYYLVFGGHRLLTQSRTELGPDIGQHSDGTSRSFCWFRSW